MDVDVKEEVKVEGEPEMDAKQLEQIILDLCLRSPKGITNQLIQQAHPGVAVKQIVTIVNQLLSSGHVDLLASGTTLIYKLKDPNATSKAKGGDAEEKLVYRIIEQAGNKGIWNREIRFKTNLSVTALNKILKSMEGKKLIKAVKSVAAAKRKVYMLMELVPDRSVTGGAWYSDEQGFEGEFVDVLNQQCLKFLQQKAAAANESALEPMARHHASMATTDDVWRYIKDLGISKVSLEQGDIENILSTLVYDGRAERSTKMDGPEPRSLFRFRPPLVQHSGLMRGPCGVCPVLSQCHEGGEISPATCVYMSEWLTF